MAVVGALAAAALAGVVGLAVWQRASAAPYDIEAIVARLEPRQTLDEGFGEGWSSPGWNVFRGFGDTQVTAEDRASFRVGVHSVDLAVAVAQRDVFAVRGAAAAIDRLELEDLGAVILSQLLANQTKLAVKGDSPDWALAKDSSDQLLDLEPAGDQERFRRLGQWAQTARLASLLHHDEYFRSGRWRKGLRQLERVQLAEDAAESLDQLASLPTDRHDQRVDLFRAIFDDLGG